MTAFVFVLMLGDVKGFINEPWLAAVSTYGFLYDDAVSLSDVSVADSVYGVPNPIELGGHRRTCSRSTT